MSDTEEHSLDAITKEEMEGTAKRPSHTKNACKPSTTSPQRVKIYPVSQV